MRADNHRPPTSGTPIVALDQLRRAPTPPATSGRDTKLTFARLVAHNLSARAVRTALTSFAVAISVLAVVTLGIVTDSLKNTAAEVLAMGNADFTVAQRSVADVLSSVLPDAQVERISNTPGVKSAVGVLVSAVKLDADHPLFLEIGVGPKYLAAFGVTVLSGRSYGATEANTIMLGWQAADDLGKRVGDSVTIDNRPYRIVGIFSTKQVFADSAAMFPVIQLQAMERKPGSVTLAVVQVAPGARIPAVRARIERENANLATVRLASEFGRVDRNLQFLAAAQTGARIIALLIGVIIVMNTMLLSFVERIREFGVLRAIGWSRARLLALVFAEAVAISLIGAAIGVSLSFLLTWALEHFSPLRGILKAQYTAGVFWVALYSAVSIGVLAALYPSLRAASLRPGLALRRE